MAAIRLIDFADIVAAVMEELKVQASDTTTKNRIKRLINMMYLDEVIPASRWSWLEGYTTVTQKAYYTASTVSVTPLSATVTLATPPGSGDGESGSFRGWYFSVDQTSEVYTVASHTALSTTVVLDRPYNGTLNATANFKIWKSELDMPTDFRESINVWHDHMPVPMTGYGIQNFRKLEAQNPKTEGRPQFYSTYAYKDGSPNDPESLDDRFRVIKVFPAISQYSTIIKIDYVREVQALELDGDEPIIPQDDRIVLYYGALSIAWASIGRNPEEAGRNRALFEAKLSRMMGKVQDSQDKPRVAPDSVWTAQMRGSRIKGRTRRAPIAGTGGGSTYNAPTYLEDVTINGGTFTGNMEVAPGITIDGVDLSVLEADFEAHLAASAAHTAANIAFSPTPDIVSTTVQAALEELQNDINTNNTLEDGKVWIGYTDDLAVGRTLTGDVIVSNLGVTDISAGVIVNADINASAAIDYSKLDLAGDIVNADINASAAIAYSKLALTGSIVNADVNASAAIAYSKLALSNSIVNADVATNADIDAEKIGTGDVSNTEFNYLNGVTSAIQTQLDAKAADNAVVHLSGTETITGDKSVNAMLTLLGRLVGASTSDNATTGADQSLANPSTIITRLNNSGLTSVNNIVAPSPASFQFAVYTNNTGSTLVFKNNTGGTAADRIFTGTGADLSVGNGGSVWVFYDSANSRWRIIGGSGGSSDSMTTVSGTTVTVDLSYNSVLLDNASGCTVTLPAASTANGKVYTFKNVASANCVIDGDGSELVEGLLTLNVGLMESVTIQCNGTAWYII